MAEATVQFLLQAVDEATATLNKVKDGLGDLDKSNESIRKSTAGVQQATETSTSAFQNSTTTLLALGNTAASVDHIFSSYANLQIRIENAELRLIDAQEGYNKALKEHGKNSEEAVNASRRLQIATNGLERANNAVVGSYINMGTQIISLIVAIPKLIIALGPLLPILLALSAAILAIVQIHKHWDEVVTTTKLVLLKFMTAIQIGWAIFSAGFLNILDRIVTSWKVNWLIAKNVLMTVWNAIVTVIETSIKFILDGIAKLIRGIAYLAGKTKAGKQLALDLYSAAEAMESFNLSAAKFQTTSLSGIITGEAAALQQRMLDRNLSASEKIIDLKMAEQEAAEGIYDTYLKIAQTQEAMTGFTSDAVDSAESYASAIYSRTGMNVIEFQRAIGRGEHVMQIDRGALGVGLGTNAWGGGATGTWTDSALNYTPAGNATTVVNIDKVYGVNPSDMVDAINKKLLQYVKQ